MIQKNFNNKQQDKKLNFHNCFFACLMWSLLFVFMQTYEASWSIAIQKFYEESQCYVPFHLLLSWELNLPIASWLVLFYGTAIPSWFIIPMFIYVIYGPKRFAKLLSVAMVVYIISFIINVTFPVTSQPVIDYGREALKNSNNYFDKLTYDMLKANFPLLSFPSNHCSDQLLLMFAVIDFNFFNRKSNNNWIRKSIWSTLISFYTICVCISTFLLKVHYFVDWIPSLALCAGSWVLISYWKKNPIENWFLKPMINTNWFLRYYDANNMSEYQQYITWGNNIGIQNKNVKHPFLIKDIVVSILFVIVLFFTLGTIVYSNSQPSLFNLCGSLLMTMLPCICALIMWIYYKRKAINK